MAAKRQNYNPALPTSYLLRIPGFDHVNYTIQSAALPGLTMGGVDAPYQNYQTNVPSNRIEFDPLNLQFLVDEEFRNYEEIYAWMVRVTQTEPIMRDGLKNLSLHILNSNKQPIIEVKFHQAYPTMVTEISFESGVTEPAPMVCTATFRYQFFEIIRPGASK